MPIPKVPIKINKQMKKSMIGSILRLNGLLNQSSLFLVLYSSPTQQSILEWKCPPLNISSKTSERLTPTHPPPPAASYFLCNNLEFSFFLRCLLNLPSSSPSFTMYGWRSQWRRTASSRLYLCPFLSSKEAGWKNGVQSGVLINVAH